MTRRTSRRLVIDASIMRAAGTPDRTDPRSSNCRAFLMASRGICHRVILTPEICAEWDKHQSRFALTWRTSMVSIRKIDQYPVAANEELRHRVQEAAPEASIARIMLKDVCLIEAALAADRIIASLDDTVRRHFARACASISELNNIIWINPNSADEAPIPWLENGARDDAYRKLGFVER